MAATVTIHSCNWLYIWLQLSRYLAATEYIWLQLTLYIDFGVLVVWRQILQHWHTATHCNTLQHPATHCNTLQHTATHCNVYIGSVVLVVWRQTLQYWPCGGEYAWRDVTWHDVTWHDVMWLINLWRDSWLTHPATLTTHIWTSCITRTHDSMRQMTQS